MSADKKSHEFESTRKIQNTTLYPRHKTYRHNTYRHNTCRHNINDT